MASKESAGGKPLSARRWASCCCLAAALADLRTSLGSMPSLTSRRASSAFLRASAKPVSGYVPRLRFFRTPLMV